MLPVSVIGIPYDKKSSFLRGPALAPAVIRAALHSGASNLYSENGISIDNEEISDKGDFEIEDYAEINTTVSEVLSHQTRLLTLGGDHSITYPILKAHSHHYDNIEVLHIDAHSDLYDQFEGDPHSHACPFARIMEENLASRLIQLGIRTLNPHQKQQAQKFGVEILEMKDHAHSKIPSLSNPIYLSLDLDALDPAFAPGVSHLEPGGFSSRQVIEIIQSIRVPIIGADIVEYNPTRDVQGITATLAAKLMKEILAKMIGR